MRFLQKISKTENTQKSCAIYKWVLLFTNFLFLSVKYEKKGSPLRGICIAKDDPEEEMGEKRERRDFLLVADGDGAEGRKESDEAPGILLNS